MDSDMHDALWRFVDGSRFRERGAVITDLDGTAVHEHDGRVYIPPTVATGLKSVHAAGRQVVINSLRFPLSVIRVFGSDWVEATGHAVPLVSMKGSQVGRLVADRHGTLAFEELESFLLDAGEIAEVMRGVEGVLAAGDPNLVVFFYPQDWRVGELIWTPHAERITALADKYRSASQVVSGSTAELHDMLLSRPLCMIFMLIERSGDERMAYQHIHESSFFTHQGADKLHGATAIARHLGLELADSIGAGDAPPDNFLKATGLSIIVGNGNLDYRGVTDTLRVPDAQTFGSLLTELGAGLDRRPPRDG